MYTAGMGARWISRLATPHDRTLRDTENQKLPALTIVVHITGRATYLNAEKKGIPPLQHLEEYFDQAGHPFAHYSVDPWGRIACHADEEQTPQAQGWRAYGGAQGLRSKLSDGSLKVPQWWKNYWLQPKFDTASLREVGRPIRTPLDLVPNGASSPNQRSIAIELIQWNNQLRLTAAQYIACGTLTADVAERHGIPLKPPYTRGHADCDPWGRGAADGDWDPGARKWKKGTPTFCWDCLFTIARGITAGVPCRIAIPTPDMPDWAK